MAEKSLGRMEDHAFFIVFMGVILVLFWHGVWELLNEITNHIHTRHGIEKWKLYLGSIVGVLLLIGLFPQILERL